MERGLLVLKAGRARLGLRRAVFEDVPAVLRLMEAAIEAGCQEAYTAEQRRAVFLSYAQTLFLDSVRPFDALVAESEGRPLAFAQIDPAGGRLRALFVAAELQGRGLGRALLTQTERMAVARGRRRLVGAMSLNAIPFYERAGYEPSPGARHILMGRVLVPVAPMAKSIG